MSLIIISLDYLNKLEHLYDPCGYSIHENGREGLKQTTVAVILYKYIIVSVFKTYNNC